MPSYRIELGPMPSYRIELVAHAGNYTCPYTATAPDVFEALVRLRRQLEPGELMVAVHGARRDTCPASALARAAAEKTWWGRLMTRAPSSPACPTAVPDERPARDSPQACRSVSR
jgi:hypothetical protein